MKEESISNKQMQLFIFCYSIGAYLLFSMGSAVKQDAWIALIVGIILVIPVVVMYGRLMNLYPGKNLFQILEEVFGKVFGKVFSLIFIGNTFFLGSYILNDFVDFIKLTALFNTPLFIPILIIGILSIWILMKGIEVLANWAQFFIRIILIFIFITSILLIPQMDITNLKPFFSHSIKEILKEGVALLTFPFSEVFLFLNFFDCVRYDDKTKNIFIKPLILGGIVTLIVTIVTIMLLGGEIYSSFYYSGYASIKRMQFAGEFQRLEVVVSVAFTIMQFMEVSFCFLGVSKGIQSVFNLKDYRDILVPVVFLSLNFTYIMFGSVMEAGEFVQDLWPFYGFFIQIIFPSLVFIGAIVKKKHFSRLH
ncbi:GerAB/ArcD/ProY family transporter [Haloimpatiens lingqiaonensis]|uniref:GerAB/ArcD/ProY family transporter n=1 Tax=Haloimpatiens lingqiaonensis TaxID=1380675 RepID=UPI0010FE2F22|nr:endospore germination permease [Haloimpatiens lingqiaonensis]